MPLPLRGAVNPGAVGDGGVTGRGLAAAEATGGPQASWPARVAQPMVFHARWRSARLASALLGCSAGARVGVKLLGLVRGLPAFVVFEGDPEASLRLGLAHESQLTDFSFEAPSALARVDLAAAQGARWLASNARRR